MKLEDFATIVGWKEGSFLSDYNITFIGYGKDKSLIDIATDYSMEEGEGVHDNSQGNHQNHIRGANFAFKNITVKIGDNSHYQGFFEAGSLGFDNCKIEGMGTHWGTGEVVFKNCEFTDNEDYCLWIYTGKSYVFENCEFTSSVGKFLHPYIEGNDGSKLNVSIIIMNCSFTNTGAESTGKPVLNIKKNAICDVSFTGNIQLNNVAKGSTDSKYFQVEEDNGSTVKINGNKVYPVSN